jgi:tRNA nucleotidyltransferase (CCA-adding enzyme)
MYLNKGDYMEDIKSIANKIRQEGGKLYLVGGAVRDSLLGKTTHDEDYCVTGLSYEKFQEIFPEAHVRGKAFAVFDIDGKEFALARTESKIGIGHKEFKIKADPKISIEEDLARRDITINSMAKDILTGEIIDPFKGQGDLKNKIIKATTEHFKEDPLRVYRVARFAAQLEFEVEEETIKQMSELKNELDTLSRERVFTELSKALLTEKPSIFFEILRRANVLDIHFKEIKDLIGAEQPAKYHPEGDAYNHTMLVLDMSADMTKNFEINRKLEIRFSALVHDLGKGLTPKEEYPHHYGHENTGVELVEKLGNKINAPNNWVKCGKTSCKEHMRGGIFYKMKPAKKVEFIERIDKTLLGLEGLQIIVISDKTSGERETDKEDISFELVGKKCLSEITGEYIKNKYGLEPGIEFGNKLHEERIKWMQDFVQKERIWRK